MAAAEGGSRAGSEGMSVILSLLGIVVAAGGVAAIGFGIPINEFTLGTTLIVVGATGLTGGLILIGLGAVVSELGRVAEALRARPVARPVSRPAEAAEAAITAAAAGAPSIAAGVRPVRPSASIPPQPTTQAPMREPRPAAAPSAGDVSAAAIERLRSSLPRTERPKLEPSIVAEDEDVPLSPNGAAHHQTPLPAATEAAPPPPKGAAEERAGGAAVEALKASRLDFLFRSKPVRPTPSPENFDTFWPAEARSARSAELEAPPASEEVQAEQAAPVQDRAPEAAPVEEQRTAAILKSGVVDGMAYTLYADGAIEAKLPHGTVRFGSIAELRAHIESNS